MSFEKCFYKHWWVCSPIDFWQVGGVNGVFEKIGVLAICKAFDILNLYTKIDENI